MKKSSLKLLFGVLSFVIPIIGIISYFAGNIVILSIAAVLIIIETISGILSGELRSLTTTIFACILGFWIAVFNDISIIQTIMVALCFESLIMLIFGLISAGLFSRKDKSN